MKLHNPFEVKETPVLVVSILVVGCICLSLLGFSIAVLVHKYDISLLSIIVVVGSIAAFIRVGYAVIKGK